MPAGAGADSAQNVPDLQRRVDELAADLREALDQQTANAEVLEVINASPGNLRPVFETILEKALGVCRASFGGLWIIEKDRYVVAALHNVPEAYAEFLRTTTLVPGPGSAPYRFLHGERSVIQNIDLADEEPYRAGDSQRRALVDLGGARSALQVPLCKDDTVIGVVTIYRQEVQAFDEKQIALLQSFAAQAMIAIQNARLLSELREALEQQTATAEVLQVINSSPGDLEPVFDAMLEKAMRLCAAAFGYLMTYDGERFAVVANKGLPPRFADYLRNMDQPRSAGLYARILAGAAYAQEPDLSKGDVYRISPLRRALVDLGGARTGIVVSLRKDDALLGVITIYRQDVRPFASREIMLLESFAAQAVIAMENARLINEQREALEQQTATAEILAVISQSPTDVGPVLSAVAKAALKFCGANDAQVFLREGDEWFLAAHEGPIGAHLGRRKLTRQTAPSRAIIDGTVVQIVDLQAVGADEFSEARELGARLGFRSALAAPLLRDDASIGAISLRRREAGEFTPRQIALLETFAAQAVIAIENVRLFTELKGSLEQQTATSEILRAISQSPTNVQPVLEAVVKAAVRFCGATDAMIQLRDGDSVISRAHEGPLTFSAGVRRSLDRSAAGGRAIVDGRTCHLPDIETLDPTDFVTLRKLAAQHGFRATVAAPLKREDTPIGSVVLRKVEPGPFTLQQIDLLETFAAQAVIAIENVRLFTELREALEQQTASAEILQVISQSPTDVAPVLTAVAKAAIRFCNSPDAVIWLRDGDEIMRVAHEGPLPTDVGARRPLSRNSAVSRAVAESRTIHHPDLLALDPVKFADAQKRARESGYKAALAAPMLREGQAIGAIVLRKQEAVAYTERQIELLEAFAAQAVVAIENVRLFTELRESLEQQTASAEILEAISQSPTDVEPVLKAVVGAARRFCGADDAMVVLREETEQLLATHEGSLQSLVGSRFPLDRSSATGRATIDGQTFHVPDVASLDPAEHAMTIELTRRTGVRALLAAPMLREGHAIGCILLRRPTPGAFTPRQIELLETFAAQAVIAIENVRLFTELRDSLDRLKAAQANLIQAEKMASLGQLTAGIAHEIKNPLNFVNNFASLSVELLDELKEVAGPALATLDENKRAELNETMSLLISNLGKITEHGKRADGIVKSMLSHSRGGNGDWQPSDINLLVEEALNLAYHGARAQDKEFNVTLERDFAKTGKTIDVVPQDVTRVFLNLFGNGFYATNKRRLGAKEPGFRPTIKVATRDLGDRVEITVRDNGTGILPEVREKLFQPFFTTKPTGEGTGLGLSISYDIVTQQHGGTIEVESEPGQFSEFTVRLPRSRRAVSNN